MSYTVFSCFQLHLQRVFLSMPQVRAVGWNLSLSIRCCAQTVYYSYFVGGGGGGRWAVGGGRWAGGGGGGRGGGGGGVLVTSTKVIGREERCANPSALIP